MDWLLPMVIAEELLRRQRVKDIGEACDLIGHDMLVRLSVGWSLTR
jgi:hypothetical protein